MTARTGPQLGDDAASDRRFARSLWHQIETIHAVTYFAEESTRASKAAGVPGFWPTYFGFRAAPLGEASAALVAATFFGFSPTMVRRSIPAAWTAVAPHVYLDLRATSAAAALRRLLPAIDDHLAGGRIGALLDSASDAGGEPGRPLFAANQAVGQRDDPVEQLWQACTTMREHRGDGHNAAVTAAGLSAPEALCLFAVDNHLPLTLFESSRGWTSQQLDEGRLALEKRGLATSSGTTQLGRQLRSDIEATTDELGAAPFSDLDATGREALLAALTPMAHAIAASRLIPFPNPIGLPDVSDP